MGATSPRSRNAAIKNSILSEMAACKLLKKAMLLCSGHCRERNCLETYLAMEGAQGAEAAEGNPIGL